VESVHGFVGGGGVSLSIPDDQIENIHKVLTNSTSWCWYPFLKVGQRVRVRGGAMNGVEGMFLSENGDHSLIISVDAIHRSMAVRIDGYDVEPVFDCVEIHNQPNFPSPPTERTSDMLGNETA
jgi:transcription antitermination factor NusG